MTRPGYEWFVAWRHLREADQRRWTLIKVGIWFLVHAALALSVKHVVDPAGVEPEALLGPFRVVRGAFAAEMVVIVSWIAITGAHRRRVFWMACSAIVGLFSLGLLADAIVPFMTPADPAVASAFFRGLTTAGVGFAAVAFLTIWLGLLLRFFSVFTSISIFGVFLGTFALVIVLSVMSGFEGDLRSKILGTLAHASIRSETGLLRGHGELLAAARRDPDVVAAQPALESEVMIISPANHQVVLLRGVQPSEVGKVTELDRYLKAPCGGGEIEHLEHPEELVQPGAGRERPVLPGVLVGCELAKSLRVYVGDDVQLAAPRGGLGPMGPMPRARSFRVAGIFYSGMYEYDSKMAFAALQPAQRLLGMRDEVTAIEIRVRDPDRAHLAVGRLQESLGPMYEITDWREANRGLFQALKLEKAAMFIVLGFIVLVASFSIVTNLIMLVLQKGREIAILKAMGSTSRSVLSVFVIEGLYIGLIGMVVGVAAGVGVCLLLEEFGVALDSEVYYIAKLPVVLDAGEVGLIALAALGISLLATAYPSWTASRLRPADGLRYE